MPRIIRIEGDIAYIPLTQGQEAIIDAADVPLVSGRSWFAARSKKTFYAVSSIHTPTPRRLALHVLILSPAAGFLVDHRDGNGLNCRRYNLRPATPAQNMHNTTMWVNNKSGVRGVRWHKDNKRWQAAISINGKPKYLGSFVDIKDAEAAYLAAARSLHGEFFRGES